MWHSLRHLIETNSRQGDHRHCIDAIFSVVSNRCDLEFINVEVTPADDEIVPVERSISSKGPKPHVDMRLRCRTQRPVALDAAHQVGTPSTSGLQPDLTITGWNHAGSQLSPHHARFGGGP